MHCYTGTFAFPACTFSAVGSPVRVTPFLLGLAWIPIVMFCYTFPATDLPILLMVGSVSDMPFLPSFQVYKRNASSFVSWLEEWNLHGMKNMGPVLNSSSCSLLQPAQAQAWAATSPWSPCPPGRSQEWHRPTRQQLPRTAA